MFDSTRFFLFLTAAVLLAVAPGPGMLYVLARCLAGGKREGVLSALGTFLGGMVHVFAAALGVSIILAKSAVAFATVKYVGAAYLGFLGVRMILDARKQNAAQNGQAGSESRTWRRQAGQGKRWVMQSPRASDRTGHGRTAHPGPVRPGPAVRASPVVAARGRDGGKAGCCRPARTG